MTSLFFVFFLASLFPEVFCDYLQTADFSSANCAGSAYAMEFRYISCTLVVDGYTSYWVKVTCTSSSSFIGYVYSNAQCVGTPIQTLPTTGSPCYSNSGTGQSRRASCVTGDYSPPPTGATVPFYSAPNTCPVTTQTVRRISWVPVDCFTPNSTHSGLYTCNGLTPQLSFWSNSNCAGPPVENRTFPSGCSISTSESDPGPSFYPCGATPSPNPSSSPTPTLPATITQPISLSLAGLPSSVLGASGSLTSTAYTIILAGVQVGVTASCGSTCSVTITSITLGSTGAVVPFPGTSSSRRRRRALQPPTVVTLVVGAKVTAPASLGQSTLSSSLTSPAFTSSVTTSLASAGYPSLSVTSALGGAATTPTPTTPSTSSSTPPNSSTNIAVIVGACVGGVAVVVAALVVAYFAFFKGKSTKVVASEDVKEQHVDQAGVVHEKVTVRYHGTP